MKTKNIFLGAVIALVGLFMIIWPGACIKAIVILLGVAAVANGVYNIILLNKASAGDFIRKSSLIKSITSIAFGFVACVFPIAFARTVETIWTIINYILAIYFLVFAVFGFFVAAKASDFPEERKRITTEAFISLLLAVLLFIIPVKSVGKAFFVIVGIASVVIGAALIVVEILVKKRVQVVSDAEVRDEAPEADSPSQAPDSAE